MAITRLNNNSITSITALPSAVQNTGLVKIASVTASNQQYVTFDGDFSSTYDNYKLFANNIVASTTGSLLYMRFRKNNADVTSSNYVYVSNGASRNISTDSSGNTYNAGENTFGRINGNVDTSDNADYALNLVGYIANPLGTDSFKQFSFQHSGIDNDTITFTTFNGSVWYKGDTEAISGFSFYFSSGNILSGTFILYGLTK